MHQPSSDLRDPEEDEEDDGKKKQRKKKDNEGPKKKPESLLTREIKGLVRTKGWEIYTKIRNKAKAVFSAGANRTIWTDENYRLDAGHLDGATGKRHVMFQVNRNPRSSGAKNLLEQNRGRGTHTQIFKFAVDTQNWPTMEELMRIIVEASKNPR